MPKGSGCSQFNGYEIPRSAAGRIDVAVTHEVSDPQVVCTGDYPIVETVVPLGSDFATGTEYMVTLNSETAALVVVR